MISAQDSRRLVWRPLWELPGRFELIRSLARRELAARYRGSALGVVWAMLTPAVMIAIYTFIFAGIFGARFGERGTAWDYALYLFCALLPWTAFQDSLQVSSNVIVAHANLVKRVVFPLEALPVAQVLAALATQMLGTIVLVAGVLLIRRELHPTILWLPALVLPQLVLMLGAAWLVASLGVFLRDTAQVVSLLLVAWMFLTPIIYPEGIVPARYRAFINANPFTPLVRNYRRVILEGTSPDWAGLAYFTAFALVVFVCGYWWFAKTRKNFADVI
ncbi:MAG: lipopolysaccharide transport system permease protein [Pyrinomonadaceae bacterium]|nr:lipopolysaccharide transport system permease protein [Pyrinomonadaceae bacterium]